MLTVLRIENTARVTRGILLARTSLIGLTLELPWRDNRPMESCIPPGHYVVDKFKSTLPWMEKYGWWTYKVRNVPNRSGILFHPGNTVADIEGCIVMGFTLGILRGEPAVLQSGPAFGAFMRIMQASTGGADRGIPLHIIKLEV